MMLLHDINGNYLFCDRFAIHESKISKEFIDVLEHKVVAMQQRSNDLDSVTETLLNAGANIAAGTSYSNLEVSQLLDVKRMFAKLVAEYHQIEEDIFELRQGKHQNPEDAVKHVDSKKKRFPELFAHKITQIVVNEVYNQFIREQHIYRLLRYVCFLLLLTYSAISSFSNSSVFWMNRALTQAFIYQDFEYNASNIPRAYNSIGDIDEFWMWVQSVFIPLMYAPAAVYYEGDKLIEIEGGPMILNTIHVIGTPRFRLLRVKPSDCELAGGVKQYKTCFRNLDVYNYDDAPYGTNLSYKFSNQSYLDSPSYFGYFGLYPGGGYVVDLPPLKRNNSYHEAQQIVENLINTNYVDLPTRILFLEMNLFEPAQATFSAAQFIVEFPAEGGVMVRVVKNKLYS
jgi:hypothetical protein